MLRSAQCNDWEFSEPLYVTKVGTCAKCAQGCLKCEDFTGRCRECGEGEEAAVARLEGRPRKALPALGPALPRRPPIQLRHQQVAAAPALLQASSWLAARASACRALTRTAPVGAAAACHLEGLPAALPPPPHLSLPLAALHA